MVAQNIRLPNIRRLFAPDTGCTIFDADLAGADAQVVAWEADEARLKDAFRAGKKIHIVNARDMWPDETASMTDDEIKATGASGGMYYAIKRAVHGTNYGGQPPGIAAILHWPVDRAERFQRSWFRLNPGIAEWHARTDRFIHGQQCWNCHAYPDGPRAKCSNCGEVLGKTVRNAFGFRRRYYERADSLFTAALAWVPQSTVAFCTELGWLNLFFTPDEINELIVQMFGYCPFDTNQVIVEPDASLRYRDHVQALLQVHDSFVGQLAKEMEAEIPNIVKAMRVRVPYPDPLVIDMGFKYSDKSWGDC